MQGLARGKEFIAVGQHLALVRLGGRDETDGGGERVQQRGQLARDVARGALIGGGVPAVGVAHGRVVKGANRRCQLRKARAQGAEMALPHAHGQVCALQQAARHGARPVLIQRQPAPPHGKKRPLGRGRAVGSAQTGRGGAHARRALLTGQGVEEAFGHGASAGVAGADEQYGFHGGIFPPATGANEILFSAFHFIILLRRKGKEFEQKNRTVR